MAMTLRMLVLTWGIALLPTLIPSAYSAAIPRGDPSIDLASDSTAAESAIIASMLANAFSPSGTTNSNAGSPTALNDDAASTSSSSPSQPLVSSTSQSSSSSSGSDGVQIMLQRRLPLIVEDVLGTPDVGNVSDISAWVSSLGDDGKWPSSEVDYTSGCDGQKANWPAELHWERVALMAAAWHGGVDGGDEFVNSSSLLDATSRAMDFWFKNDFTVEDCLGGKCDCSSSGFWNSNWFSNTIAIPKLVGETCLLIGADNLSDSQMGSCTHILNRSAATLRDGVPGIGKMTGANTLDIAKISVDLGLLTKNDSAITDAYTAAHKEVVVQNTAKTDGIRADGSFAQHGGILYNGNYGKDYANDVLALEIIAGGTKHSAQSSNSGTQSQQAFETLLDGDQWMMYRNAKTGVVHWDFSVLNRMISFPVADDQATGSININVSHIQQLGSEWNSPTLQAIASNVAAPGDNANVGNLTGNRMFYANDYMVQRGSGYVTTLKMFSSRTLNTECINDQNPFGFHLSDGTVYTYMEGTEYGDIAGAWDWNLIPGTTTNYAATKLDCGSTQFTSGEAFVGGASDGKVGAAAMRYKNPATGSLSFQKAWFFLDDDVQHVMVAAASTTSDQDHPVISVLDQKRLNGAVVVDGQEATRSGNFSGAASLWHDNVGYTFNKQSLSVNLGQREADWRPIGISKLANTAVNLFSAWLVHGSGSDLSVPVAYTAYPAVSQDDFAAKSAQTSLTTIQNDKSISAVFDETHQTAMFVFWDKDGGSATFTPSGKDAITVQSSGNSVVMYKLNDGTVTVSDPSQSQKTLHLSVTTGRAQARALDVDLPQGGEAGKSVTQTL
ncbi:galactose mutarotase-like protein [Dichomitus squalens LYAD-421 SS1]|uniref:galactose mutarotase-like protein n=1 Tax=Dichomitus squalens (strain LYAD-421) TaxID=732165 RepID=UPI0004415EFD|nr:galactose mutarotase-like protein [Dichomitus squalens LYAD-421 SS1]EJF66671.1 galactose mutarotase-like protein [Dichomitus squalens LYAD-421 SS1]